MTNMIPFLDFYDDIDFMIALFYNHMLNNVDIYEIAIQLNNKNHDDVLAKIIANGVNGNNEKLFDNYLNELGIKFAESKKAIAAKVFYYILADKIDFYKGIRFVHRKVSIYENTKTYVGDDIGIEEILGNFYMIDDGDISSEKNIETTIEFIISDLKQYINDYLVNFIVDNNISKDDEKVAINSSIEKKVKGKALAKGIQAKNYWGELYETNKKLHEGIISQDEFKTAIDKIKEIDKKICDAIEKE